MNKIIKRNKISTIPELPRVAINFNRKILDRHVSKQLRDTLDGHGSLRGEAVEGILDDFDKLRFLCEEIVKLYKNGESDRALQGLHMLSLIL